MKPRTDSIFRYDPWPVANEEKKEFMNPDVKIQAGQYYTSHLNTPLPSISFQIWLDSLFSSREEKSYDAPSPKYYQSLFLLLSVFREHGYESILKTDLKVFDRLACNGNFSSQLVAFAGRLNEFEITGKYIELNSYPNFLEKQMINIDNFNNLLHPLPKYFKSQNKRN